MRKTIISLAILLGGAGTVCAAHLEPDEALANALSHDCITRVSPIRGADIKQSYHLKWTGDQKGVYVFDTNKGAGFLVVAGDDSYPALLGYSDSGDFDIATAPPALIDMIRGFDAQIASGIVPAPRVRQAPRAAVAPLIKTKWNQTEPYNLQCPTYNGEPTLTGCVATAMAQLLKFYENPAHGTGTVSYRWTDGSETLTYDFEANTFDWGNMLDEYDESATEVQRQAVARLMLACGMASGMQYSTTFSGATDIDAAMGLVKYMGYDRSMQLRFRDFYTIDEWNSMIYNELSQGRPVPYFGFSPIGGHAFICDGYQYDDGDYFHINWGWSGLSDGYYMLNLLNPPYIGAGGSVGGFNRMESAMLGCRPAVAGTPGEILSQMLCFGYFATEKFSYSRGNKILFGIAGGLLRAGFYNMSLKTLSVELGVKLTSKTGGTPVYIGTGSEVAYSPGSNGSTFTVSTDGFPGDGIYIASPAYKLDGKWIDMPQETQMHTRIELTIAGDAITIETVDDSNALVDCQFEISSPVIVPGKSVDMTLTGMSHGLSETLILTPVLIDEEGYIRSEAESKYVAVYAGEGVSVTWSDAIFQPEPEEGAYRVAILDNRSLALCIADVAVVGENTVNEYSVENLRINRALATTDKPSRVSGETLSVAFKLGLVSGYFDGEVNAYIFSGPDARVRPVGEPVRLTLLPGSDEMVSASGTVNGLDRTLTYYVGICVNDVDDDEVTLISDLYPFVAPDAGIATMEADIDASVEYFSLQGIPVDKPVPGTIVICRRGSEISKFIVR